MKSPKADIINGNETFKPPTMKKRGVIIAKETVLNLFFTTFVPDVSVKCFDIISPKMNAGSIACPSPKFAK